MHLGSTWAFAIALVSTLALVSPPTANGGDGTAKVTTVPVPERGQAVAARVDAEGTIHLLFNSARGPRYTRSKDAGKSFDAAIPIMVDRESLKVDPRLTFEGWDMAVGKGGVVHVAFQTPNAWKLKVPLSEWGLYYTSLEPGAKSFAPARQINRKPSEGFSLAADDKGNVSACWLAGKLYANVSRDNGKTFGPAVELNPAYDPCNCCTTSSVYAADGRLALLYREETNNERDMHLIFWDQEKGQTSRTKISKTPWKIDTCPMTYYNLSRAPGGFVAAWPTGDRYDIYFARLDAKGNLLPPGEIKTPGKASHRTAMLALSAADGSTLVAWTKDNQLGWQLYDAKGTASGRPGSAPSTGSGVAGFVDRDGCFILFTGSSN